eukprot:TRINITY_DN4304_c0_g1_i3.p1 TRINITY_DN4304_c0_g1~~TRINITY_DN4304_c0_g1_i3.p1  ORF type:complete len:570 (+),score=61.28 TRINITY_DN4304_c0_g1_i3:62-1711(+)
MAATSRARSWSLMMFVLIASTLLCTYFAARSANEVKDPDLEEVDQQEEEKEEEEEEERQRSQTRKGDALSPMIIFPGFVGSPIEYTVVNRAKLKWHGPLSCRLVRHPRAGKSKHLWVNLRFAARFGCWKYLMKMHKSRKKSASGKECAKDAPGVKVIVPGFGTLTQKVNYLRTAPIPPSPPGSPTFNLLINELSKFGYNTSQESKQLAFAPYDFRKVGDPCWEEWYYPKVRHMIEGFHSYHHQPVTLMCLSAGCPVVHTFLALYSTKAWKDKYIKEVFAMGPAWGGAVELIRNIIEGPKVAMTSLLLDWEEQHGTDSRDRSIHTPLQLAKVMGPLLKSWPGMHSLLPNQGYGGFADEDVFVTTQTKNYTMASLKDGSLMRDIGSPHVQFSQDFIARAKTLGPTHPGVRVNCIYPSDKSTVQEFRYEWHTFQSHNVNKLEGYSRDVRSKTGDGIISADNMEHACSIWKQSEESQGLVRVLPIEFGGPSHVSMFNDRRILALVSVLMGFRKEDFKGDMQQTKEEILKALDVKKVRRTEDNVAVSALVEEAL